MTENIRYVQERERALELGRIEDREVLDVGAGPLARMAVCRYDCFVTCIDVDPGRLEEAERDAEEHGVGEKISFEREDVTDLPYGTETFDVGILFGTLHHIPPEDREQALDEMARVVYERLVVAELTPGEYARFHGEEGYGPVDPGWLEERLRLVGTVSTCTFGAFTLFIVEKKPGC